MLTEGHLYIYLCSVMQLFCLHKAGLEVWESFVFFITGNAHPSWVKLGLSSLKSAKFRHVSKNIKILPSFLELGLCVDHKIAFPDFPATGAQGGAGLALIPSKVSCGVQITRLWVTPELLWKSLPAAALEAGETLDQSWVFPKEPQDWSTALKRRMTGQDVKTERCKDTFLPPGSYLISHKMPTP